MVSTSRVGTKQGESVATTPVSILPPWRFAQAVV